MLGVSCCMDVIGRMNSTCVQLYIHSTLKFWGGVVFACQQGNSVVLVGSGTLTTWNCDQGLLVFKVSTGFSSTAWYHHLGD